MCASAGDWERSVERVQKSRKKRRVMARRHGGYSINWSVRVYVRLKAMVCESYLWHGVWNILFYL